MSTLEQVTQRHRLARRDVPFFFAGIGVIVASLITTLVYVS
jgi:hypothetical protein